MYTMGPATFNLQDSYRKNIKQTLTLVEAKTEIQLNNLSKQIQTAKDSKIPLTVQ